MTAAVKVNVQDVKALREETGAPIGDVRSALEEAKGDKPKAREILKRRGVASAEKRAGRSAGQGRVEAYIHHDGKMGALVEVNCETDFVARTPDFQQFCRDLALHVAAASPRYLSAEAAPDDVRGSANDAKALCLLEQPFVKDQGTAIKDLVKALIAKTGENVVVRRFTKFTVGEAQAPSTS